MALIETAEMHCILLKLLYVQYVVTYEYKRAETESVER